MAVLGLLTAVLVQAAPEPADWQQGVDYVIEAELDESAEVLRGVALLSYRNAAPDTLDALYFHLYLNAFRPHSLWARTERRRQYDFSSLEEPDYGYERLARVALDGRELSTAYPHAPDSTVVRVALPDPLAPGDSVRLRLEWESRPSTLCRRQCRRGRHYDFAQWYPRIAVYDVEGGWQAHPLYPQGEFYGEFATYDVTLDLAADQVVGATGVPITGDPGWRPTPGSPGGTIDYRRDAYGAPRRHAAPGFLPARPAAGRKRVRFYAERVHHFAWSVDPGFMYEGGRHRDVAIHVLFRPGDLDWDLGTVVRRAIRSLDWLEGLFGPYAYPQLTLLHRLEGGGTEFPMLIMNGGSSQGLIMHEVAHQYAHAILANNEWREAWLDEGMASFLDTWFEETHGIPNIWADRLASLRRVVRRLDLQPVATASEEFVDYGMYGAMSYTKASVVFYMLREYMGRDTFRRVLAEYYRRYRLRHVSEHDFRRVCEDVSGEELGWFFDQWLHSTATLDYALGDVTVEPLEDGGWSTRVVVLREGEAWMPVGLRVGDVTRRLDSRERWQLVEMTTSDRPGLVELDPELEIFEVDRTNNRREL